MIVKRKENLRRLKIDVFEDNNFPTLDVLLGQEELDRLFKVFDYLLEKAYPEENNGN